MKTCMLNLYHTETFLNKRCRGKWKNILCSINFFHKSCGLWSSWTHWTYGLHIIVFMFKVTVILDYPCFSIIHESFFLFNSMDNWEYTILYLFHFFSDLVNWVSSLWMVQHHLQCANSNSDYSVAFSLICIS